MRELEVKQLFETLRLRTWSSGSQASLSSFLRDMVHYMGKYENLMSI